MIIKYLFLFFSLLFVTNVNAQIKYEDSVPSEYHGIWADNCAKPSEFFIRIDKYTTYEGSEYGTFLDIPKLRLIDDYLAVIYPASNDYPEWFTFLKIEDNNLIIRYEPDDFDKMDFSFLKQKDDDVLYFVKCETIPNKYKIYVDPINNLLENNVLTTCIENSLESLNCISSLFNYFDIYNDSELSMAELTQMSKILINYLVLDGNINTLMDEAKIEDKYLLLSGASFTFAPSFSQLLLINYDFNNSNSLSLDELLNNKSDFINNINFILKSEFSTFENAFELLEDVF